MEDYEKFRAVLVDRAGAKSGRRPSMAELSTVLLIAATLLLIVGLVMLVHDRMPALVNVGQEAVPSRTSRA